MSVYLQPYGMCTRGTRWGQVKGEQHTCERRIEWSDGRRPDGGGESHGLPKDLLVLAASESEWPCVWPASRRQTRLQDSKKDSPPRSRAPWPPRGPSLGASSVERSWLRSLPAPRSRKAIAKHRQYLILVAFGYLFRG